MGRFGNIRNPDVPPEEKALLRAQLVQERIAQLDGAGQDMLREKLRDVGALKIESQWVTNVIQAEVPAGMVSELLTWDEVVSFSYDDGVVPTASSNGLQIGDDTLTDNFLDENYDASSGGNSWFEDAVNIAIIDTATSHSIRRNHPTFQERWVGDGRAIASSCTIKSPVLSTKTSRPIRLAGA